MDHSFDRRHRRRHRSISVHGRTSSRDDNDDDIAQEIIERYEEKLKQY